MIRLAIVLALWPLGGMAQVLSFPGNAELVAETASDTKSDAIAVGPWVNGTVPRDLREGAVRRQAWRIPAEGIATLQVMRPLRQQLRDAGFDIRYDCETKVCGGFDFRFALDVMLPPDMQVDLRDFRYLAATKDDVAVWILVSRSAAAAHVQVTFVTESADTALATPDAPALRMAPVAQGDLEVALDQSGRFILNGLTFATGSAQLDGGAVPSLQALADYLARYPDRRVALVGHTDAEGSLEANIALSRRRAGSVVERLVADYGVSRRQLDAQGMGYLSPVASNLNAEGRDMNRRVEVIVTSTAP